MIKRHDITSKKFAIICNVLGFAGVAAVDVADPKLKVDCGADAVAPNPVPNDILL